MASSAASASHWEAKTVKDLQEELKKCGLATKGKKAELIERLCEHFTNQSAPADSETPAADAVESLVRSRSRSRSIKCT